MRREEGEGTPGALQQWALVFLPLRPCRVDMSTTTTTSEVVSTANESSESTEDNYSPYRVEGRLEKAATGVKVHFEQDGEKCTNLVQFSTDEEALKGDAIPDENGIEDMEEAIREAEKGWSVDILIHEERARLWAVPDLVF